VEECGGGMSGGGGQRERGRERFIHARFVVVCLAVLIVGDFY